jgi:CRP/FNR family transcriptional regulator, cyclic AMP receptor protein
MEDLDLDFVETKVSKEADKLVYDVEVARAFFQANGKPATINKDGVLFAEKTPGGRMYFIIRGDILLSMNGKSLDVAKAGEILGEMSVVTGSLRTATAVARSDCMLVELEGEQFKQALSRQPEFALMLMHMMLSRLRLTLSILRMRGGLAATAPATTATSGCVLNNKLLLNIAEALGPTAIAQFPKGRNIILEGATGVSMYAILQGAVVISIQGKPVETAGAGGIFGEMTLIDSGPRAASVAATSDCKLLAINRDSFMKLVKSNPLFGFELLKGFAERLRYLNALRK